MRGKINAYRVLVAKGDLGEHGRYFKVDLMVWDGRVWAVFIWLRIGPNGGPL
jgi:hypothetical protein